MSENRNIARAAGIVGALTLVSRVTGLLRDAVIGYAFGTGAAADAFFVAFRIPNLLRRFVAEGASSIAFVPVFTQYLTTRGRAEALTVARILTTILAVPLVLLTVVGVGFAPWWVGFFAPGFSVDPPKLALTVRLTRIMFPFIALVGLVAISGGLLNSLRRFAVPAMSSVLLNLAMIGAVWMMCPRLATPIDGLAAGVLLGGILQVLLQIVPLLREGVVLRPLWAPRHPAVRHVLGLMAPVLFGAAVYQVNLMFNTIFASLLPAGSVSYLWYADRVFEFPLGLFAVAVGTAALPSFAAQAARQAYGELRASLGFAIRLTSFITLPATAGLIVLATPITVVLFRRGAFGMAEAEMTARALQAFSAGLWAVSLVRILVPACYALHDTRTPVWSGLAAFVANLAFNIMFIGPIEGGSSPWRGAVAWATGHLGLVDLRHAGLALSTSLAAAVNLLLLAAVVVRRLGGLDWRDLGISCARSAAATTVMIPVVALAGRLVDWASAPFWMAAGGLGLAIGAGLIVFAGTAYAVGSTEAVVIARLLRERLMRAG